MKTLQLLIKTNSGFGPLAARLFLGAVMFPHGAQKVLGWFGRHSFTGTMQFFTGTMHIPALFAFLAIAACPRHSPSRGWFTCSGARTAASTPELQPTFSSG